MSKQKKSEMPVAAATACCASFTPGPWKADGYHVRQSGQRGTRMIADVCYTGPHHTPPDEYPKSCRLADEANARLIAAAPMMLEALRGVIAAWGGHMSDDGCGCADCEYLRPVEQAIREAYGHNR
jgi:hypothetical protein